MKNILRTCLAIIVLLITSATVFLYNLDLNRYKPALIQLVGDKTGRRLIIEGDVHLLVSLTPTVTAGGIRLGNPEWAADEYLLTAGRAEARFSLLSLLLGNLHVNDLILEETVISLETGAEGIGNWVLVPATAPAAETAHVAALPGREAAGPPALSLQIEHIDIRNARVSYRDTRTGINRRLHIEEISARLETPAQPMQLDVVASYGERPFRIGGTVGSVETLLADSRFPLDLDGSYAGLRVKAAGAIERPLSVRGLALEFSAETDSLSALNGLTGMDLPVVRPVALSGSLHFEKTGSIHLDNLKLQAGETQLGGRIDLVSGGERPAITADFDAAMIDLVPFQSDGDGAARVPARFLFPREDLRVDLLKSVDVSLDLSADLLRTRAIVLDGVQAAGSLDGGLADLKITSGLAGGSLNGDISLRASALPAALNMDIAGQGIVLGQLPHQDGGAWFDGGTTQLHIRGSGTGNSIGAIMGSLDGEFLVQVGEMIVPNSRVELFGADLLTTVFSGLNPFSAQEQTAIVECAVIMLDIEDGIADIDRQIAVQTNKFSVVGSGRINFATEEINLGIRPYARQGLGLNINDLAGVAGIGGTLSAPQVKVDSGAALKTGVTAGAAFATGGLSLLAQALFNKTTNDPNPCLTALGGAEVSEQSTELDPRESGAGGENGGVFNNVRNSFRRLIGN